MKTTVVRALLALLFAPLVAAPVRAQVDVKVAIDTEKPVSTLVGFGAEWDPFFWRSFNTRRGCDEKDWDLIVERVKRMQPDFFRIMVQPQWYEPENDNDDPAVTDVDAFTWESAEMLSLYRYLDVCDELNIDVNITVWGAPVVDKEKPYWLAEASRSWITAPNDAREWAENLEALVVHLLRRKNYRCVKYVTQMNEPNLGYKQGRTRLGFDDFAEFVEPAAVRIRKAVSPDRIKFMNPDAAIWNEFTWLARTVKDLAPVTDVYAIHSYNSSAAEPGFIDRMRTWAARAKRIAGDSPVFLNEYGDNNAVGAYSNRQIDTYERGLFSVS